MRKYTNPKESATRKYIDARLTNLGWEIDEKSKDCNVFTERCKTTEQNRELLGKEPDYVLCESGTDNPIAVIETKRSGQNLKKAIEQAIRDHATPLGLNVIFVSDGGITESYDLRSDGPLRFDDEPITDLLSEAQLLRFVREGPEIRTPAIKRHSKQELIRVFAGANDLLRKEGLREGIERFSEFSNLLFLKLISEIEDDREKHGEVRILEKRYCWGSFCARSGEDMLDYINDTILPRLVNRYNHSGDVFQPRLAITNPDTLKDIVDKLSQLTLLDTDSDIKGDAFEYFLKHSVTVGNDLGEYFTPRHIVKLIVQLVDPKFDETIYDPCCGTGGFLIEAFKHIKAKVKNTPANITKLKEDTIYGREFTATASIAKMNMIITGDGHNNIKQMDSLKEPVKGERSVVLTNYPFSQKTDYATLYGLEGQDANPVFLMHVVDALEDGGRAGVVVPEGLLFDPKSQYVKARRMLCEKCQVEAVIKLHEYVFKPYTGQPTSILFFTKGKPTTEVWFFEVKEDGFEKTSSKLGRKPSDQNDLRTLRSIWDDKEETEQSFSVPIKRIEADKYRLSMSAFLPKTSGENWLPLGGRDGVCDIVWGGTPSTSVPEYWKGRHPWVTIADMKGRYVTNTSRKITDAGVRASPVKKLSKGTVLLSFKLSIGKVSIAGCDLYTNEAIAGLVPKDERVLPEYLYHLLSRMDLTGYMQPAAKGKTLNSTILKTILIPIPTPTEQRGIIRQMNENEAKQLKLQEQISELTHEADDLIALETSR